MSNHASRRDSVCFTMKTRKDIVFFFLGFILFTLPFLTSACLHRGEHERGSLFISFQNSSLTGSTIKSTQVKSSIDCVHECLKHPQCVSVNFQTNDNPNHWCELCSMNVQTALKCPERKSGYTHLTSPYEGNITCPNSPCKNGGTCFLDCGTPSGYRCTCTSFHTGPNCEQWTAAHCNGLPLGLEDKRISDSQLSASSTVNSYHLPKYARLNAAPGLDDAGSWRGASRNGEYFQVDILTTKMITKIATQGRPRDKYNRNQWITKYSLAYSTDGSAWVNYRGDSQSTKIFDGNSDRNTIVTNTLGVNVPIVARYIRIVVKGFVESPSLRAELYGCSI